MSLFSFAFFSFIVLVVSFFCLGKLPRESSTERERAKDGKHSSPSSSFFYSHHEAFF
jgi:hypothetical protein